MPVIVDLYVMLLNEHRLVLLSNGKPAWYDWTWKLPALSLETMSGIPIWCSCVKHLQVYVDWTFESFNA